MEIVECPFVEPCHGWLQGESQGGQRVVDTWRYLRVNMTGNYAVGFQFTQLTGQYSWLTVPTTRPSSPNRRGPASRCFTIVNFHDPPRTATPTSTGHTLLADRTGVRMMSPDLDTYEFSSIG